MSKVRKREKNGAFARIWEFAKLTKSVWPHIWPELRNLLFRALSTKNLISGCGPVGRALDLGSRRREFESPHSDHSIRLISYGVSRFLVSFGESEITKVFNCFRPILHILYTWYCRVKKLFSVSYCSFFAWNFKCDVVWYYCRWIPSLLT